MIESQRSTSPGSMIWNKNPCFSARCVKATCRPSKAAANLDLAEMGRPLPAALGSGWDKTEDQVGASRIEVWSSRKALCRSKRKDADRSVETTLPGPVWVESRRSLRMAPG